MSKLPQQRPSLTQYLNQECVCRGKVDEVTENGICLVNVHVNNLYFDHLWVNTAKYLQYCPKNEWVYFTGIVIPYRKRNFSVLSYTLTGIQIIIKTEYEKRIKPFLPKKKKGLKHIQNSVNERIKKY
jgi:hypothetical protein